MAPIHHLTKAGQKCLLDWMALKIEEIQLPSGTTVHFQHDYFHRVSTVWFAIQFQQWLAANCYGLVEMNVYFNSKYVDGQFKVATRTWSHGRYVEPDITALYRANGGYHTILFEQHNGKDAKRALKQIEQHCSGLMHKQSKNVRIIYVFQNPTCMRAVMKAMMACPKMRMVQHQFLFKNEMELQEQFSQGWYMPDGTVVTFLPLPLQ